MSFTDPITELHASFSDPAASATAWETGLNELKSAEVYWLTTVRPDGRPHVTPLNAVWHSGCMYFATGPEERKALNLATNSHCILTTGCNALNSGLDIVVEGQAERESDASMLHVLAHAFADKYPSWDFNDGDGEPGLAHVYRVRPRKAFGFAKGKPFSQTRWQF